VNCRLQVLIPPDLDAQLRKAAQPSGVSKGEWVRRVLHESLRRRGVGQASSDALARLESLGAPTSDIDRSAAQVDPELLQLLGVVAAVQQIPFLGAFRNVLLLGADLGAGGAVDFFLNAQ
jgi:hypothetical protein